MKFPLLLLLLIPWLLSACAKNAKDFYASVKPGKFRGKCTLETIGKDYQNGYPLYVLRQDASDPFRFQRWNGEVVRPRTLITSGGNIPWVLQLGVARDPGTYWDAYVIHDWLFDAHRLRLPEVRRYSFQDTAMILAEAQKTMIESGHSVILDSQRMYGNGRTVKASRYPAYRDVFSVYANYVGAQTPFARVAWLSRYQRAPEQYQSLGPVQPWNRRLKGVAIRMKEAAQKEEAADLNYRLRALGVRVDDAEVRKDPLATMYRGRAVKGVQVRYFSSQDRRAAERVAALLDANQPGKVEVRQLRKEARTAEGRWVEVWYGD